MSAVSEVQTAIPYVCPRGGFTELSLWRDAMGDHGRVPVTVPLELSVSVGALLLRCEGDRLPAKLPALLKRLVAGKGNGKPAKAPAGLKLVSLRPGARTHGVIADGIDYQTRAYHAAMASGSWS